MTMVAVVITIKHENSNQKKLLKISARSYINTIYIERAIDMYGDIEDSTKIILISESYKNYKGIVVDSIKKELKSRVKEYDEEHIEQIVNEVMNENRIRYTGITNVGSNAIFDLVYTLKRWDSKNPNNRLEDVSIYITMLNSNERYYIPTVDNHDIEGSLCFEEKWLYKTEMDECIEIIQNSNKEDNRFERQINYKDDSYQHKPRMIYHNYNMVGKEFDKMILKYFKEEIKKYLNEAKIEG